MFTRAYKHIIICRARRDGRTVYVYHVEHTDDKYLASVAHVIYSPHTIYIGLNVSRGVVSDLSGGENCSTGLPKIYFDFNAVHVYVGFFFGFPSVLGVGTTIFLLIPFSAFSVSPHGY